MNGHRERGLVSISMGIRVEENNRHNCGIVGGCVNEWLANLQCTVKVPVAVIDPTALSASQMYSPSSFRVTPSSFRLRSSKMCTRSVDMGVNRGVGAGGYC